MRSIPAPPSLLKGVLLAALALLPGACASSASSGGGQSSRIVLRDYLGHQSFELVSESLGDPLEYRSQPRNLREANRKFLSDEMLAAFLDYLDDEGMKTWGREGPAPSTGGGVITRSFEVQRGDRVTSWVVGTGTERNEKLTFTRLTAEFLQLYTETPGIQAVDNPEGRNIFEDSQPQGPGH